MARRHGDESSLLNSELYPLTSSRPLWPAYACESLSSVGTSLLSVGIFFYTTHYFAWGMKQNLLLAAAQGAVYVIGSLVAARLADRFGQRRSLFAIYACMTCCALVALAAKSSPAVLIVALVAHTLAASANWPLVENLVTAGADAHAMSRRVGVYNLVWSITNAVIFAISGTLIEHWRAGMFLIPVVSHALAALLMLIHRNIEPIAGVASQHDTIAPEPELIRKRTLALTLARIALPATYVVIFTLVAMMPSLSVMKSLDPAQATLIASAWMVARVFMFVLLGATTWWHTRPSLLLLSAAIMLFAFIGVTTPLAGAAYQTNLLAMMFSQIILGVVLGLIYSGSLYFGMVLSDGSTEHGGYHEALIGAGCVAGPGIAYLAQSQWPANPRAGVTAVSAIVGATIVTAGVAALRADRKKS